VFDEINKKGGESMKKKLAIYTLAITLVVGAATLFASKPFSNQYGMVAGAPGDGAYTVTLEAGDALSDAGGTYVMSAFDYKVYFANIENVTFGGAEDGYFARFGNGGYVRWDNTQNYEGISKGFKILRTISATWTAGPAGVVMNAYGGDFVGGQITVNGGKITDAEIGCTNTYFNAAYTAGPSYLEIISLTLTYDC